MNCYNFIHTDKTHETYRPVQTVVLSRAGILDTDSHRCSHLSTHASG